MDLWIGRDADKTLFLFQDKPTWFGNRWWVKNVPNCKNRYSYIFNRDLFPKIAPGQCKQIQSIIFKEQDESDNVHT